MIPLKNLVALNPGEVIGGQDNTMAFYSQSYALVRFLREEGYGKRLSRYNSLLLGGLRGTWPLSEEYKKIASDRNIRLTVEWKRIYSADTVRKVHRCGLGRDGCGVRKFLQENNLPCSLAAGGRAAEPGYGPLIQMSGTTSG